jgi:hypothetical protein
MNLELGSLIIRKFIHLKITKNKMMIEIFLRAKHYQIFLLTIGIPFAFQFAVVLYLMPTINGGGEIDDETLFSIIKVFPVLMMVFIGVIFGWLYSIGIGLQSKLPEDVKMQVGRFKIFFFIPLVYISLISMAMFFLVSNIAFLAGTFASVGLVMFIFLFHLFSMFCIFYVLYFAAKTFKTVELQKEVRFSEFAGEFFMLWIFPIGVWILQPKINKIMEEEDEFL